MFGRSMQGPRFVTFHGPYTVDAKIQEDGTKLSDLDIPGWHKLRSGITDNVDAIIQYGIAKRTIPAAQAA
jgi:3-keto-5-aminohexanoate cleavage enzyme